MILRGVPQNTPLRILSGAAVQQVLCAGYGTDPRNLAQQIFVLDLNAGRYSNDASVPVGETADVDQSGAAGVDDD